MCVFFFLLLTLVLTILVDPDLRWIRNIGGCSNNQCGKRPQYDVRDRVNGNGFTRNNVDTLIFFGCTSSAILNATSALHDHTRIGGNWHRRRRRIEFHFWWINNAVQLKQKSEENVVDYFCICWRARTWSSLPLTRKTLISPPFFFFLLQTKRRAQTRPVLWLIFILYVFSTHSVVCFYPNDMYASISKDFDPRIAENGMQNCPWSENHFTSIFQLYTSWFTRWDTFYHRWDIHALYFTF